MSYRILIMILVAAVLSCRTVIAQEDRAITLADAFRLAEQNRPDLQGQLINIELAQNAADQLKTRTLPRVSASGDLRTNPLLQTSIIPGAAFSQGGTPEKDREVRFGTTFNALFGIEATYPVLDPTLSYDRQLAALDKRVAELQRGNVAAGVRQAVAEAYYAVLLAEEKSRLSEADLARQEENLGIARRKAANGTLLSADLLQLQVDLENARLAHQRNLNELGQTRAFLANQLGMPPDEGTRLSLLDELSAVDTTTVQAAAGFDPGTRLEIQAEGLRMQGNELNIERLGRRYWPALSFYGNLSAQHLSNDFTIYRNWFPFAYLGLKADITLFDGRQRRYDEQRYRLSSEQNKKNMEQFRRDFAYEAASARLQLENAGLALQQSRRNHQLARELAEVNQTRFREGTLLIDALRNAEFAVREAENNLLRSLYDIAIARIRYLRATGTL